MRRSEAWRFILETFKAEKAAELTENPPPKKTWVSPNELEKLFKRTKR